MLKISPGVGKATVDQICLTRNRRIVRVREKPFYFVWRVTNFSSTNATTSASTTNSAAMKQLVEERNVEDTFRCSPDFSPPFERREAKSEDAAKRSDNNDEKLALSERKWFLKLSPFVKSETGEDGEEFIGVYLFLRKNEEAKTDVVRARYVIGLLNADGERCFVCECPSLDGVKFDGRNGYGMKFLAPRKVILGTRDVGGRCSTLLFLGDNDTLQIFCEVEEYRDEIIEESFGGNSAFDDDYDGRNVVDFDKLRDHLYNDKEMLQFSLPFDLSSYFGSSNTTNVKIISDSGTEFHVHRSLLSARSVVFKTMLDEKQSSSSTKQREQTRASSPKRENECSTESRSGVVTDLYIRGIDDAVLLKLLTFIYTDVVANMTLDMAKSLMFKANQYKLFKLKRICEDYIATNGLTPQNANLLSMIADICECEKLPNVITKFAEASKLKASSKK